MPAILVGQRSLTARRRGRYVAGSGDIPARISLDLAAALIHDNTSPGDRVLDPLAGAGTTLVDAVHAGRDGSGVEIEPGWIALARACVGLDRSQGATGTAHMIAGDHVGLPRGIPTSLRRRLRLALTSPPGRRTMHGRVDHRRGRLLRCHPSHGMPDPASPANHGHHGRHLDATASARNSTRGWTR